MSPPRYCSSQNRKSANRILKYPTDRTDRTDLNSCGAAQTGLPSTETALLSTFRTSSVTAHDLPARGPLLRRERPSSSRALLVRPAGLGGGRCLGRRLRPPAE